MKETILDSQKYIKKNNQNKEITELKNFIKEIKTKESIDFKILKTSISLFPKELGITIYQTIKGTEYYFEKPKKIIKTAEYQKLYERNKKLEEDSKYKDIMKKVIKPKIERKPYDTFKGQAATGMDLVVTVGTFFLLFYFASQYMFNFEQIPRILFGTFGAIVALILESFLSLA